ncbi:YbaK/EbsC family protein [Streptomyces chumphonensis]|uniref:YbaK/EbsC family protein n=1 Tax=Streptomyces chumphonensis TaxID=1214925 RepID=UPI003D73C1B6
MATLLDSHDARKSAATATGRGPENSTGWSRLLGLAACRGARFRFGPTAGDPAARCVLLRVKRGRRTLRHVIAVVPEQRTLDLIAVARLYGGTSAGFVTPEATDALTGGTDRQVPPHSADPGLEVVLDQSLRDAPEIGFNDVRPSVAVTFATEDYTAIAAPRVAVITATA